MGFFRDLRDFWDFLGYMGFLGFFGILWDFWDFMELLTEKCKSDFFGVITDVSTEIRTCQPKEILSTNKAEMCGFGDI